jgi:hypothetical protein
MSHSAIFFFEAFNRLVRWQGLFGLTVRFCASATVATAVAWLLVEYFEERFYGSVISALSKTIQKTETDSFYES